MNLQMAKLKMEEQKKDIKEAKLQEVKVAKTKASKYLRLVLRCFFCRIIFCLYLDRNICCFTNDRMRERASDEQISLCKNEVYHSVH